MIRLQYKKHPLARVRKKILTLGGFELEAPQAYTFKGEDVTAVRKGQLSTQFRLNIPTDGICQIPDTQYNRDKLKTKFQLEKDGITKYYIFDILSNIDLSEEAPHAGGGMVTKDEERTLKQKIKELEEKNLRLSADLESKKTVKKTGGRGKKGKKDEVKKIEEPKTPSRVSEALGLQPDLA